MTSFPGTEPLRSARGYTLAELLVVMAIIGLIGGLGASAYQVARRNYGLQASAGRIQGVLRAARNGAVTGSHGTYAVVDPSTRTVTAQAYDPVAEWSFDDTGSEESGTAIHREVNHGGTQVPGVVGKAMSFRSGEAYVDCGVEPRFDLRSGILVEAWVRHDEVAPIKRPAKDEAAAERRRPRRGPRTGGADDVALTILGKEGAYALRMTRAGALEGSIGDYRVRTDDGVVLPGRWVRVEMRYDGKSLDLASDGVPREVYVVSRGVSTAAAKEPAAPAQAPVTPASLTISSGDKPFPGDLDEVRLSGATEPIRYTWTEGEQVIGWKKVLRFDRRGHLDPAYHSGGVRFVLVDLPDETSKGPVTGVPIDFSVTFEEWRSRFAKPESVDEAAEEAKFETLYASARKVSIEVDRLGVVR